MEFLFQNSRNCIIKYFQALNVKKIQNLENM